ncbi:MAG: rod shape-determining protein [Lachnospiraceae bacterium]|nr:rod shape-determining protein [Lachnospiraceae bacterium]
MDRKYCEPADIKVYVKGKGILVCQKSLIAYELHSGKIVARGNEAGRKDSNETAIKVLSPIKQGRITDFNCAYKLLEWCLKQSGYKKGFLKQDIMVCVPEWISEIDKKAYEEVLYQICSHPCISTEPFDKVTHNLAYGDVDIFSKKSTKNYRYIIGICKDEPILYAKEQLMDAIKYAKENGMTQKELMDAINKQQ